MADPQEVERAARFLIELGQYAAQDENGDWWITGYPRNTIIRLSPEFLMRRAKKAGYRPSGEGSV